METALDLSGQPVRRGTMAHEHDVYALLADSAAHLRDEAALARYASPAQELADRDGHKLYQAIAHRAQGVAARLRGELAEAEAHLSTALALFQELGARWQTARTLVEQGEVAQARVDSQAARALFAEALAAFEQMQAAPDAAQARARLVSIEAG